MADDLEKSKSCKDYAFVETKRHKPCLIFDGYRYVQDKIQNRTIYWRCEDRARCNGRAHQLVGNGSMPVLTIKHNHRPIVDEMRMRSRGYQRQRHTLKTSHSHRRKSEGKQHLEFLFFEFSHDRVRMIDVEG